MSEQNKAIVRRLVEEAMNRRNYAVADELLANDFGGHTQPQDINGPEGFKQFWAAVHEAFPDFHCTIEEQIAEGDRVVTRWTARGTHRAEFMGVPATGKPGEVTGIFIDRIVNGKIVEGWTNWDALGLLVQLGAVPAPQETG